MIRAIFRTVDSWGPTFLRIALGGVMFPHGAQKMLGWFEGNGWAATLKYFTETMQIPLPLAMAAIITEFVGAICLALGLFTRFWAIGMGILIGVAGYMVHWQHGFFINWFGKQKGEGIEFHLLVLGMSVALAFLGAGKLSFDQLIGGTVSGGGAEKKEKKSDKVKLKG